MPRVEYAAALSVPVVGFVAVAGEARLLNRDFQPAVRWA